MAKTKWYDGIYVVIDDVPKELMGFFSGLEELVHNTGGMLIVDKTYPIKAGKPKLEISPFNGGTSARIKIIHPPFGCNLNINGITKERYVEYHRYVNGATLLIHH